MHVKDMRILNSGPYSTLPYLLTCMDESGDLDLTVFLYHLCSALYVSVGERNIWQGSDVLFLIKGVQNVFDALGYIQIWGFVHCKSKLL